MEKIKLFLKAFYKIPFLIPTWTKEELIKAYSNSSKDSKRLREKIKKLYNVDYAFDFNLGRSAIQIALRSFGLKRDDEVIISTYSCRGVIEPIIKEKLRPILVDIDENYNISPKSIERNITKRTKVIIMSHLYGYPAQIDKIVAIAKKHKLYLIDDAAQVVGLKYKNQMVGTFGDIGILSFGIGKSISATGGGMLITNNRYMAEVANLNYLFAKEDIEKRANQYWREYYRRSLSAPFYLILNKFKKRKDWDIKKMSYFDCALISSQLDKLDLIIKDRILIANNYSELLKNTKLILPKIEGNIFTKYVIMIKSYYNEKKLSKYLRLNGIETETNYKPLHLYPEYKSYKGRLLLRASIVYAKVLTIPNNYRMYYSDRMYVAKKIKEFFNENEQ